MYEYKYIYIYVCVIIMIIAIPMIRLPWLEMAMSSPVLSGALGWSPGRDRRTGAGAGWCRLDPTKNLEKMGKNHTKKLGNLDKTGWSWKKSGWFMIILRKTVKKCSKKVAGMEKKPRKMQSGSKNWKISLRWPQTLEMKWYNLGSTNLKVSCQVLKSCICGGLKFDSYTFGFVMLRRKPWWPILCKDW